MFITTLQALRDGAVISELDEAAKQLIADIRASGKPGDLWLKIHFAPMKQASDNMLIITEDIKVVPPPRERGTTVLYATDDNELSRRDPRQPELKNFRETAKVATMPPAAEKAVAGNE